MIANQDKDFISLLFLMNVGKLLGGILWHYLGGFSKVEVSGQAWTRLLGLLAGLG